MTLDKLLESELSVPDAAVKQRNGLILLREWALFAAPAGLSENPVVKHLTFEPVTLTTMALFLVFQAIKGS